MNKKKAALHKEYILRQLGHLLGIEDPQLSAPPSQRVWLYRKHA